MVPPDEEDDMRLGPTVSLLLGVGAALPASSSAVLGLDEPKGEKAALKACERRLCELVTKKAPTSGELTCGLSKTWAKSDLKDGSATGRVSWGFGDARCTVNLKLARATIVSALNDEKATVQFPEHAVNCVVERDEGVATVTATLAPKAKLEGGQVKKVWVNLKNVEGPGVIKGLAITVAKLEDKLGIFHRPLVKSINKLLHEKCPKVASGK
ncbi:MAG: hypothetical protein AB7L90_01685 [Hyphomicrobiaceae bacterium]